MIACVLATFLATTPVVGAALEVVFLPDDASAPALAVVVRNQGERRTLSWLLGGARAQTTSMGGLIEGQGAGSALVLPLAPAGASVVEREGGIVVTIDDAGAWQAQLAGHAKVKTRGPAVADARALRLVVSSYAAGAPALLLGTEVRLSGRAHVVREAPATLAVLAEPARVLVAQPSAVAVGEGCGATVPRAFSAPEAPLRLEADADTPPACAAGLVLVRVHGVRTDPKKDVPLSGVVVTLRD